MNGCILALATIGLLPSAGTVPDTVKIGVASSGRESDAMISTQAARAPYILIFDQEARCVEVVEDRDVPDRRAGPRLARTLKEKKVTHYIAGRFGQNLVRALDEVEIEHVSKTGAADKAVEQLLKEIAKGSLRGGPRRGEARPGRTVPDGRDAGIPGEGPAYR